MISQQNVLKRLIVTFLKILCYFCKIFCKKTMDRNFNGIKKIQKTYLNVKDRIIQKTNVHSRYSPVSTYSSTIVRLQIPRVKLGHVNVMNTKIRIQMVGKKNSGLNLCMHSLRYTCPTLPMRMVWHVILTLFSWN